MNDEGSGVRAAESSTKTADGSGPLLFSLSPCPRVPDAKLLLAPQRSRKKMNSFLCAVLKPFFLLGKRKSLPRLIFFVTKDVHFASEGLPTIGTCKAIYRKTKAQPPPPCCEAQRKIRGQVSSIAQTFPVEPVRQTSFTLPLGEEKMRED
jgi:hypothetical protein